MPPGDEKKYFIDSHLHLFNIDHIPIFTLLARLNLDLIKPLIVFVELNKLRDEFKKFFLFFESDIEDNVKMLTGEIETVLKRPGFTSLGGRQRILTPLMMDFEKIPDSGHEKLKNQSQRLIQTLGQNNVVPDNYKILPFLGLDLRRFEKMNLGQIGPEIDALIKDCAGNLKSKNKRKNPSNLVNGDVIGIKLYPPIGFDPFPEDNTKKKNRFLAVFRHLYKLNLPITVHCQKGSYQPDGVSNDDLERYTTPTNWARILAALKAEGMGDIRINFGHFGGEDSIKSTICWEKQAENVVAKRKYDRPDRSTWTHIIVELLLAYKNTYADISAFNYLDEKASLALAWLLALDHTGELGNVDGKYRLCDKLLWGSDYPLPIKDKNLDEYEKVFSLFYKTIHVKKIKHRTLQAPGEKFALKNLPDRKDLLDAFTHRNPKRFLFGG